MPTVPDIHRRGTRAAQATIAAPPLTVGTLYFVTDEGVTERWTGSVWETYSGGPGTLGFYQLTGDVTAGPGVGTQAATITAGVVTYAKLQAVTAASRLLGRGSAAGAGAVEEITLGTNLTLSGTTLNATAGGGTPSAHKTTHENGGADEISVVGLSGLLADQQTPLAHATTHDTGGSDPITALSGSVITSGTVPSARLPARIGAVGIVIDGGGSVITTGVKGFVEVPFACTITAVTLLSTDAAATSGSIVVDIWKDTYANYPPVVGDSITASAKPTLSSAIKSRDTTLTGWTTAIAAGEVLGFSVTSATTVTKVALSLTVQAI